MHGGADRRELEAGLDPSDPDQLYRGLDEREMDAVIVGNLRHTWAHNHEEIVDKRNLIRAAIVIIFLTTAVAALLGAVVS